MKFKKTLLALGIAALAFTTACSNNEPLPAVMSFHPTAEDAAKVVEMIDSITVADMTTEQEIEQIYLSYCNLDDENRELVTNYDKLTEYRKAISELYYTEPRQGSRMDRTKVNIGTYCFNQQCWNDEGVQALVDCGIDFIANASYNDTLLDLLDKYGVGAFASGVVPGWYTGGINNGNVGFASTYNPLSSYETAVANFVDRDCIWGIDIGDEPWSVDIPHFGKVIDYLQEAIPDKIMYLNLLPGAWGYKSSDFAIDGEMIDPVSAFAKYVNTDYISYDMYPYHEDPKKIIDDFSYFFECLQHTQDTCNANDRDLWVVIQANSKSGRYLTEKEVRMQASACLAYGARALTWACWNAGWFDYNIADSQGNLGDVYYHVQKINKEIDTISLVYSKYENVDTGFLDLDPMLIESETHKTPAKDRMFDIKAIENCSVSEVKASNNTIVATGYFEKLQGEGSALMFANATDYWTSECDFNHWSSENASATVFFTVKDPEAKVMAYYNGDAFEPEYLGNGQYRLTIGNSDNVFVTIE